MKCTTMLAVISLAISFTAQGQYAFPYYYLGYSSNNPYSNNFIGSSFFTLPRPGDTYTSIRIRSLAEGFSGVIRDPFTDHFRNPAWDVCENGTEVFGDFGSVSDLGKFMLGSFIPVANEDSKGVVGINVTLDRMMKSSSKNSVEEAYSSSASSSRYNYSSLSEYNPERVGGRLSYGWQVSEQIFLGISYEYMKKTDGRHDENSDIYSGQNSGATRLRTNDDTFTGSIHTASFGTVMKLEGATLQLFARGLFSTNTLMYLYQSKERSSFSQNTTETRLPTDADSKAGLVGTVYEIEHESNAITRVMVEAAYTTYSASGKKNSLYEYGDSIRITSRSGSDGSRSSDGSIWDIKAGVARELPLSDDLKGMVGLTVNYVKNTYDGKDESVTSYMSTPPQPSRTERFILDSSLDGFDIRLPIGFEFSLSQNVLLNGGIEPRYRTGEISETGSSNVASPYPTTSTYKTENTTRGLLLSTQAGIAFKKDGLGVLSVLVGKNVADMTFWSVFMRYFL